MNRNPAAVEIRRVTYTVPSSRTGAGDSYTVTADPKDGTIVDCTCPDRQHRGRVCKHMKLIASPDHGGIRPRVRVRPLAPPRDSRSRDTLAETARAVVADRGGWNDLYV